MNTALTPTTTSHIATNDALPEAQLLRRGNEAETAIYKFAQAHFDPPAQIQVISDAIPEPPTVMLLDLGLVAGATGWRRRRA